MPQPVQRAARGRAAAPQAPWPLAGSLGFLDGAGRASASFFLPAGTAPGLAGAVLYHAASALNGNLVATKATNPLPVLLAP